MKFTFAVTLLLAIVSVANAVDTIKPLAPSNFCKASKLTPADGTQLKQPSCVSLEIGQIPAVDKMVSALIVNPRNGQAIKRNTAFKVDTKISNLATGFFSDPAVDYYQIQQTLDVFAFFKGLNDAAVNGVLSVLVEKGLPQKGQYRICTMNSSNSHQPVVMPVAQRGAQDDCIRINVI
ncbi:ribosomal protein s17 protein [Rhizophagus irregularis DAOM 181602=DAOM 197198]|nr:ribosomal protein s17 protein [Rhizophagus irregularis DAOM 181602=DAOM 197198]